MLGDVGEDEDGLLPGSGTAVAGLLGAGGGVDVPNGLGCWLLLEFQLGFVIYSAAEVRKLFFFRILLHSGKREG